jgi:Capsular polysaccharide biosynthesis protein
MGIDDGAEDIDEAVSLINMEISDGVDTIALTPHFQFEYERVTDFVVRRNHAYETLICALDKLGIHVNIIPGAEVMISPLILQEPNLRELCYSGTNYILIEFPLDTYYQWIPHVLYHLKVQGITPVIAHVERYPYITRCPDILRNIINYGCLTQVNASSLVMESRRVRNFVIDCIKQDLIHTIATDTHSVRHRPPVLSRALTFIESKIGYQSAESLKQNGNEILSNLKVGMSSF